MESKHDERASPKKEKHPMMMPSIKSCPMQWAYWFITTDGEILRSVYICIVNQAPGKCCPSLT